MSTVLVEPEGRVMSRDGSRRRDRLIFGWLGLAAALAGLVAIRPWFTPWIWMWLVVGALVLGFKALTLLRLDDKTLRRFRWARLLGYLFLWPGMRPQPFLEETTTTLERRSLWISGAIQVLVGGVVLWILPVLAPSWGSSKAGLIAGMIGLSLFMHFGIFQLLAAAWRARGVAVEKVFNSPGLATSLTEFWSRRWNRAFADFARDLLLRPLSRVIGVRWAGFGIFVFSGLVHELVITVPAGGGYGGPTLYFIIQGLLVLIEGARLARLTLGRSALLGWLWTAAGVLGPVPLLFPAAFRSEVVAPLLTAIGAGQ